MKICLNPAYYEKTHSRTPEAIAARMYVRIYQVRKGIIYAYHASIYLEFLSFPRFMYREREIVRWLHEIPGTQSLSLSRKKSTVIILKRVGYHYPEYKSVR